MTRIQTTQGALARRGFVDAQAALATVSRWDGDVEPVLDLLAQAADPDLALTGLDRLLDRCRTCPTGSGDNPVLARQLVMVLGASVKLAEHLCAHPEHLDLLAVDLDPDLGGRPAARSCCARPAPTRTRPAPVATELDRGRAADRPTAAPLLRIAARDLCSPEPIEVVDDIADELSDLADATLEAALSIARAKAGPDALKTRLAVVGLGKCGAQELNYVSDVDVLFVAEPVLDDARRAAAQQRRRRSRWRPGWRPRSPGSAPRTPPPARSGRSTPHCGPRARRVSSSAPWPATGPTTSGGPRPGSSRPCSRRGRAPATCELGEEFVDDGGAAGVAGGRAGELRLRHPGDAQAGGRPHPRPRRRAGSSSSARAVCATSSSPSSCCSWCTAGSTSGCACGATLAALKALVDNGYVGREDGKGFALAYRFLRALEHRIQLFNLRRTHVLPDRRRRPAPARPLAGLRRPGRGAAEHLAARVAAGPAAARAAVLLPAARRRGPDPQPASCG